MSFQAAHEFFGKFYADKASVYRISLTVATTATVLNQALTFFQNSGVMTKNSQDIKDLALEVQKESHATQKQLDQVQKQMDEVQKQLHEMHDTVKQLKRA